MLFLQFLTSNFCINIFIDEAKLVTLMFLHQTNTKLFMWCIFYAWKQGQLLLFSSKYFLIIKSCYIVDMFQCDHISMCFILVRSVIWMISERLFLLNVQRLLVLLMSTTELCTNEIMSLNWFAKINRLVRNISLSLRIYWMSINLWSLRSVELKTEFLHWSLKKS